MKVLAAQQIHELDAYTIKHEPISSVSLMERAAGCIYAELEYLIADKKVFIFCGMGNNGGDGLALARMLKLKKVSVFVVKHQETGNPDFQAQLKRFRKTVSYIENTTQIPAIPPGSVVIDAIFGTGLKRPADGIAAAVIRAINKAGVTVFSVDVPSGLHCDRSNNAKNAVIKADMVYTFHAPKLSFFFPENEKYVPDFKVLDIGLDKEYVEKIRSTNYYLDRNTFPLIFQKRSKFSHKGNYGHALIIAGSLGKMGAAVLALKAALRSGTGLVSALVPGLGYSVIQSTVPEAMLASTSNLKSPVLEGKVNFPMDKYSAVGVGPGIGTSADTTSFLESLFDRYRKPMVIDADALNIISSNKKLLKKIPAGSILTPHPGEFRKLAGEWKNDVQKFEIQKDLASTYQLYIVLKGAHTSVATPDGRLYFNSTGNPGMAKGGSGDVLTGVMTSLLAQGYTSEQSALMGVYVHGKAGDIASKSWGEISMNAGDIINHLFEAFIPLESNFKSF